MKRFFLVALFIMAFPMAGIIVPTQAADVIKIGCITPLSGGYANYGINTKPGLEMALEEVNAKGGVKIKGKRTSLKWRLAMMRVNQTRRSLVE